MCVDYTGTSCGSFWSAVGRFIGGVVLGLTGAGIALISGFPALFTPGATVVCEFGLTIGFYGAGLVGSVFNSTIYSDMDRIHWNPYNRDAAEAASSSILSFYQGVPIIRTGIGKGRSGSFGIIGLDYLDNDADTVRHEFGHVPQLMMLGIIKYGLCVALPSAREWYKKTSWAYYQAPWDAGADLFGGIAGAYSDADYRRAIIYLAFSYFLGPIVHSFYKKL